MVFGSLVVIVGLMLSIAVHELGHLLAAKRAGARVSEFMIGFGPRLGSFTIGPTRYGLKLLPLGGYVRILGMHAPGKGHDVVETEAEQAVPGTNFYELSTTRKTVILLAGVTANLLLAATLLATVLGVLGLPTATNRIDTVSECSSAAVCTEADEPSPAAAVGITSGDRITGVDATPVESWNELVTALTSYKPGDNVTLIVERDGNERRVDVVLDANPRDPRRAFLGVSPSIVQMRESPRRVPGLVWMQAQQVGGMLTAFPAQVGAAVSASVTGEERNPEGAIGIVGAGRIGAGIGATDQSLAVRLGQLLTLLAGLNVSLAVFNIIPLVPLDGGHVAVAWFEGARRRIARARRRPDPGYADMRRLLPLTYLVVAVFMAASLLLLWADIVNPVTLP